MGKRILIEDNAAKAELLIEQIEKVYLGRVSNLVTTIQSLGIKGVNKDTLLELIDRNLQPLEDQYRELCEKDLALFTSPELRNQVENTFALKFDEVRKAVEAFYCLDAEKRLPFSFIVLAGVWDLNDSGMPYVPEEKKAVLREGFKEYIEDPELLRIYSLHTETARKIQELVNLIREKGIDRQNYLSMVTGLPLLLGLFEIVDNSSAGEFCVKPRRLNYKVEPVEVEPVEVD